MESQPKFPSDRIVSGSLCYMLRAGHVLMLRRERPPHQGYWSAPGGKMMVGESPDECVVREVHEETGLTIAHPLLRAIVTVVDVAWPIHWLLFIYRADAPNGDFTPSDEGELRWIPLAELDDYQRPYADLQYWPHVLSDDPSVWRGKFVYHTPATLVSEERYM